MVAFYIVYRFGIWLRQDVALIAMVPVPRAVDPDSAAVLENEVIESALAAYGGEPPARHFPEMLESIFL